jgi:uncharacterized membrane protein YsdA (DUF1294 family)
LLLARLLLVTYLGVERIGDGVNMSYYLTWLVTASVILFVLYGLDKARARKGAWRVPEITLHVLALAGGFAGGWAGRSIFHHKTKKGIFPFVLILSTVIHAAAGWWVWR